MKEISYHDFVLFLFKRTTQIGSEWFFKDNTSFELISNEIIIQHSKKVFEDIAEIACSYSDIKVCHGLQYLIDPTCGF